MLWRCVNRGLQLSFCSISFLQLYVGYTQHRIVCSVIFSMEYFLPRPCNRGKHEHIPFTTP